MKVHIQFPPFIKNSDYIPHLIEHCLVSSIMSDINKCFQFHTFLKGFTNCYGIIIDFWRYSDLEAIQSAIKSIYVDKKYFITEKKSLQEELSPYSSVYDFIVKKVWKLLYGNNFSYGKKEKKRFQDIAQYINYSWIDKSIISDNEYNIAYIWKNIITHTLKSQLNSWYNWKNIISSIYKDKRFIAYKKISCEQDIWIVTFIEFLIDWYSQKFNRYDKGNYFFPTGYKFHFQDAVLVACPYKLIWDILEAFNDDYVFNACKKGFIFDIQYGSYKSCFIDFVLLYWIKFELSEITKYIMSLDKSILNNIFIRECQN